MKVSDKAANASDFLVRIMTAPSQIKVELSHDGIHTYVCSENRR